ncbi:MAG TPA: hypothetical protein VFD36_21475 [Kofleriaceae bacterium]|nr:hypothetical protein [Kofleriaceae bacterium]
MPTFQLVTDSTPRDNGGYVLRKKAGTGAIGPEEYLRIGVDMVLSTFPFNQLNGLDGSDFVDKYEEDYHLFFLPRNLYTLFYLVFLTTQKPDSESTDKLRNMFVGLDVKLTFYADQPVQIRKVWDDLVACLEPYCYHFGQFNAWAVAMLTWPGVHNKYVKLKWPDAGTLELTALGARYFATSMVKRLEESKNENITQRVLKRIVYMAMLDALNPEFTFLTRFGSSDVYTTYAKDGAVQPDSFSQSFGACIFAGHLGDTHANTLLSLNKDKVFTVPVHIASYKAGSEVAGDFFIPPIPAMLQVHAALQELWHPRTRVYPIKGKPLESQDVQGLNLDTLYKFDSSMSRLQVLLYQGGELTKEQAIQRSKSFNAYVQMNKIDLPL